MQTICNEIQLREQLVTAASWVREQLRRADIGSNFTLTISVDGPIQIGEAKLVYKLDHTRNYESAVTGNSLSEVTFELLRRTGWTEQNQGLQLTWDGAKAPSLKDKI